MRPLSVLSRRLVIPFASLLQGASPRMSLIEMAMINYPCTVSQTRATTTSALSIVS